MQAWGFGYGKVEDLELEMDGKGQEVKDKKVWSLR